MHAQPPPALELSRPIQDVIRSRSSYRSYQERAIVPDIQARLDVFLQARHEGVFNNTVRLALREMAPPDFLQLRQSGTYGFIKGAERYLIGAVERSPDNMLDFGFCFERAILFCTDLGLQTCWLGGTLSRSTFAQRMGTQPSEIVPAVSPVGYATPRRALRDVVIRLGAGSHKRRPWPELFFDAGFGHPLTPSAAGSYHQPLELLRLAPSASNQQPWRVVRTAPDQLHFYLYRTPLYRTKLLRNLEVDLQQIDLGIAMCHFAFAAKEAGLEGQWERHAPAAIQAPAHTEYVVSWRGA